MPAVYLTVIQSPGSGPGPLLSSSSSPLSDSALGKTHLRLSSSSSSSSTKSIHSHSRSATAKPISTMARLLILFALCVLPAFISATRPIEKPFVVVGKVFCDTCRCGFETSATTYIPGAKVRVECKNRQTLKVTYQADAVTDASGAYKITVADDHKDELCESMLLSSPQTDCTGKTPGRDRSRVILTNNNGIVSNIRHANAMGFMKDSPLSGCTQLLKQYQEYDE